MNRAYLAPPAMLLLLAMVGCSSTAPAGVARSSTPASAKGGSAAGDGLTGFGATWETWDATRAPDSNAGISKGHNTGYSPDQNLPVTNGTAHDRYSAVQGTADYVTTYHVNFRPGTDIDAALGDILSHEFPADATWLWRQAVEGSCYHGEVQSATLAKLGTAAGIGDGTGEVYAAFYSLGPGGNQGYEPTDVSYASLVFISHPRAGEAAGC